MSDKAALPGNFRGDCEGCVPVEVESCGSHPTVVRRSTLLDALARD